MEFNIIHPDADVVYKAERERLNNRTRWTSSQLPDLFFLEYRDWIEYEAFLYLLPVRFPELVSLSFLSEETIQGRQIPVLTLSTGGGQKPGFYIQAALHAREWLANSATTYILNALAEGYGNDQRITDILDAINIYIVPTVNIDGYIYTWTTFRNWRKNRRNNGGGTFGVDLNRNYDKPTGSWGTTGISRNPSSDIYCGTSELSEPETRASANFITNETYNIMASFDMHTYGRLLLRPYGYTGSQIPEPYEAEFFENAEEMHNAIRDVHGEQYRNIPAYELYPCSGTAVDYAFSYYFEQTPQKIVYSYTFEGRGTNFAPPPSNIIPAGQEQLAAVLVMAEKIMPSMN